jgi:FkbM family methyltransferase
MTASKPSLRLGKAARRFLLRHPRFLAPLVAFHGERIRRKYGCTVRLGAEGSYLAVRKGKQEIRISVAHNNYLYDIASDFDYYFTSVLPEHIGGRIVADFSRAKLHPIPGIVGDFLFTSLPEGHSTNAAYLAGFKLGHGQVVIDAGAYCGLTTCLFARAVGPEGRVIAIEADPANYAALASNVERQGLTNVSTLHAALWREECILEFAAEGNMGSAVSDVGPRQSNLVSVQAITLDSLCERMSLTHVDHVKMDIEGAEYEVIFSSAKFIETFRPSFIVEIHNEGNKPANVGRIEGFFTQFGYVATRLAQSEAEIFPLIHFKPK